MILFVEKKLISSRKNNKNYIEALYKPEILCIWTSVKIKEKNMIQSKS